MIRSILSQCSKVDFSQFLFFLILAGLLSTFILSPILQVLYVAFTQDGFITLFHFLNFFQRALFREAFLNSLFVGVMVVIFSSLIALPLAFFSVRYDFKGKVMIQTLGILPLVMPPFVGAIAMQLILGRNGVVNLLFRSWFDFTIPFMDGLIGIIIVQTLHYFPFILLNASASLASIDLSLEEAGQNLGAHGFRLLQKITLPLMMPGYVAGALLVFIKSIDDLGTPLLLNYTNMLAPQAYIRITNIGVEDKAGYVISVILVALSLVSLWSMMRYLRLSEYATLQRGATGVSISKSIGSLKLWLVVGFCTVILLMSLSPHIGIIILSFAKFWSFSLLPKSYTLSHYAEIFIETPYMVWNTLIFSFLAAGIDVILGAFIAFLLIRGKIIGKGILDLIATLPLAIPGVVLATGYLRMFHAVDFPILNKPLTETWIILVIAYATRRLPYTLRSCYASMQQIHESLEEAALNLGANRRRTFVKITFPLMLKGVVAGGVISFITSSVELSSTMMLVPTKELAPLSYGIYLYMQSATGRGPGACLGVIVIVLAAFGTYIVNKLLSGGSESFFKL